MNILPPHHILEVEINQIKPYENNPRINDDAVEPVANSIKAFGFQQPLVLDKNNVIIVGHTRYKAAKLIGLDKVPCIIADDLTDEQAKAYRLADNKVADIAEWDVEKLENEMNEITNIDMSQFKFPDINDEEINVGDFFDSNHESTHKNKTIKCPYCGAEFEK